MKYKKIIRFLKNLNTLYPEILKGIHKNEGTFYRIGKHEKRRLQHGSGL
jgi:hypothetical protein